MPLRAGRAAGPLERPHVRPHHLQARPLRSQEPGMSNLWHIILLAELDDTGAGSTGYPDAIHILLASNEKCAILSSLQTSFQYSLQC